MSKPIETTLFVGPMGHDVDRIARVLTRWLTESGLFAVTTVGVGRDAKMRIPAFMRQQALVDATDLFIFLCADDEWTDPHDRRTLENAVASGAGVLFYHGLHPTYRDWPEAERMIGLLWRQTARHGDFGPCTVEMTDAEHPITEGVSSFDTEDELFCALENVWNVPMTVLATAHSDANLRSRWGCPGTRKDEPVLTTGQYGQGRTVDFILGHVWTHYTGHGLMENTLIALEPPQFKTLFMRSCEWAATGTVDKTRDFPIRAAIDKERL